MKKIFPNIKYKKPPPIQEKILKDLLREVGIIIPRDFWGLLRSLQHIIPDESTTIQKQRTMYL